MHSCPAGSYLTSNPTGYYWSCDAASSPRESQKSRQHSKVIYLYPSCREIHEEQFHSTEGFYLRALQRTSFSLCALVTLTYNHRMFQSDNRDSTTRRFKWDVCSLSAQRGSERPPPMCPEEICSGRSRRSKLELATKATLSWCLWAGGKKHVEVFTSSTFSLDAQQTPTRLVHQQRKRSWRPCSFPEVQPLLCMGKAASVWTLYSKCFWEGLMC